MKLLECLENEAFNELINFSFEEVRTLFNWYAYYVPTSKAEPFVSEAIAAKIKYEEELEGIEKYAKEEYSTWMTSPMSSTTDCPMTRKTIPTVADAQAEPASAEPLLPSSTCASGDACAR